MITSWWSGAHSRRAQRALERQLEYQRNLAAGQQTGAGPVTSDHGGKAAAVRELLPHIASAPHLRVLEVGNGARGMIVQFPSGGLRVGLDPLAVDYRVLFPAWSGGFQRCAGFGEHLPFRDESFDVVICDNVIDHAEEPFAIVGDAVRALKNGGVLFFSVNVHHRVYRYASTLYGAINSVGPRFEINAFADHTVHLTLDDARSMLRSLPLDLLTERDNVRATASERPMRERRLLSDYIKRVFFKNARYIAIGRKRDGTT